VLWYPADASASETAYRVGPPGLTFFHRGWVARGAPLGEVEAGAHPLVLLSHGTGGSAGDLSWLAETLASRGYLVAGVSHHGNSILADDLSAQGFFLFWERAPDLSRVLDELLSDPELGRLVDRERIGVAGFSLGGHTVVLLAGGRLDIQTYYAYCERPDAEAESCEPPPESPFGLEDLLEAIENDAATRASIAGADADFRDPRIRAAYAIAPAAVAAMPEAGMREIGIPLRVVVGEADTMAPADSNAARLAGVVPGAQLERLEGVDHYTFLGECGWAGRIFLGEICDSGTGVPRAETLEWVALDAYDFFESSWTSRSGGPPLAAD
jgi:predicted dienelactone hydrolase